MTNPTQRTYEGRIAVGTYGEDDDALILSDWHEPLAERIREDLDDYGSNVTVRYWISDTPRTADELTKNLAKTLAGAADADYTQRYSEITGYLWTDASLKVGGHDLLEELENYEGYFLRLEIEYFAEEGSQA